MKTMTIIVALSAIVFLVVLPVFHYRRTKAEIKKLQEQEKTKP